MNNLIKCLVLAVLITLAQSCAFDGREDYRNIIGRVYLSQTFDSPNVSLLYNYRENAYSGLAEGCLLVEFDRENKVVYVVKELNPHYSSYYVFELLDYDNTNTDLAYKKREVDKAEFEKLLSACTNCVTYYDGEGSILEEGE